MQVKCDGGCGLVGELEERAETFVLVTPGWHERTSFDWPIYVCSEACEQAALTSNETKPDDTKCMEHSDTALGLKRPAVLADDPTPAAPWPLVALLLIGLMLAACGPVSKPKAVNPGGLTVTIDYVAGYPGWVRVYDMPRIISTGNVDSNTLSNYFQQSGSQTWYWDHVPDYVRVDTPSPSGLQDYTRGADYVDKLTVRFPK